MQSFALPSSQTGLPISQKRKRQVTPEFDVVVKKKAQPDEDNSQECASPYFNSPAEGGGKDGGGSKDGKREKTKREMLLERDDWVCTALSQPLVMRRGPSRLSVLGQDDSSDRGWNDEETSPPAEDQASDSGGDVDDNGDGGGYDDVGGGAEEVLGGDDYSGGIEAGDEDEDEGEHIPVGDGNGYTKLDGGGYVQIGGPARRAPTPQPRSWGPPGILRHKDSREGSEDTMLLDFDIKERPIFHYNHITPTIPKCVERWLQARQTNEGSGGYSSSPLAAYSRRRGHRIPSSRCGDPDILGKSSVRGAEGMPSITESSPLIVHAQLGSDPFRRSEPRASPRPKSRFNFWKGPSKGNPTAERYHSENESNAVSYVPGWGRSSQGTPFVTSTLGSPCPGSKPRILSQTKDPVEAVDEILRGEEDIQWERFVRDSPVGDVAGGAHLPCTDTAGAIRGTNSESNRDSKSKEIELRSFNDWYDFNKYTRANCPLEPNEEHIAPISHNALCGEENSSNTSRMMENAADNRASWAEFLAAPLESDGPESPGEPPKRIPDIGPPQASGAPPYRKSAVLDAGSVLRACFEISQLLTTRQKYLKEGLKRS